MFLSVALLAASTITVFAGERPRDNGIACARAANAYCNVPDEGNEVNQRENDLEEHET